MLNTLHQAYLILQTVFNIILIPQILPFAVLGIVAVIIAFLRPSH
jgi:hypothetical protein